MPPFGARRAAEGLGPIKTLWCYVSLEIKSSEAFLHMCYTTLFKILTGSWGIPHIPRRRQRYCPPFDLSFSLSSFSSPPKFVLGVKEYHTLSYGPVLGLPFHRSSFPSFPRRRLSLQQKWLAAEAGIFSTRIGRRPLPPARLASGRRQGNRQYNMYERVKKAPNTLGLRSQTERNVS